MAKQKGILPITGTMGGLIFYQNGNEFHVRSMPATVHQSHRTQIAALHFGKASKLGGVIRHAMNGMLSFKPAGKAINSFNTALLEVLRQDRQASQKRFLPGHFNSLQGFCFTPDVALSKTMYVTPSVVRDYNGRIHVTIPAMDDYTFNPQATHICVKAVALSIRPGRTTATAAESEPAILDISQPSPAFTLEVPAEKDAICCVMLEVTSLKNEGNTFYLLQDKKYTAAEIIAVLQPKADKPATPYSPYASRTKQRLPQVSGLVINAPKLE